MHPSAILRDRKKEVSRMTIKMNPVTSRPMTPVNADLLISKIKEERYTFKMIENALHISSTSFYNKIQGKDLSL